MTLTIENAAGYGSWQNADLFPDIFSGHVIYQLQKASVADQVTNTDFEGQILGGASTVKIITAPVVSVDTNVGKGAKLNLQNLDTGSITMRVDQDIACSFIVDSISQALSNIDLMEMSIKEAVYRVRDAYDTNILSYMEAQATALTGQTVGFSGGETDPVNIFNIAREQLDLANVPYEDCFAVVSPAVIKFLMATDSKLLNVNEMGYNGKSPIVTPAAPRFNLAGMDVFMSNNVTRTGTTSSVALFGHKSAVSTAKALVESSVNDRGENGFGKFYKSLLVYGRQVIRDEALFKMTVTNGTLG